MKLLIEFGHPGSTAASAEEQLPSNGFPTTSVTVWVRPPAAVLRKTAEEQDQPRRYEQSDGLRWQQNGSDQTGRGYSAARCCRAGVVASDGMRRAVLLLQIRRDPSALGHRQPWLLGPPRIAAISASGHHPHWSLIVSRLSCPKRHRPANRPSPAGRLQRTPRSHCASSSRSSCSNRFRRKLRPVPAAGTEHGERSAFNRRALLGPLPHARPAADTANAPASQPPTPLVAAAART